MGYLLESPHTVSECQARLAELPAPYSVWSFVGGLPGQTVLNCRVHGVEFKISCEFAWIAHSFHEVFHGELEPSQAGTLIVGEFERPWYTRVFSMRPNRGERRQILVWLRDRLEAAPLVDQDTTMHCTTRS